MEIINLTPHPINVLDTENKEIITLESKGLARCTQETIVVGDINGIPLTSTTFGEVQDLPEEQEDKYYVVSRLVLVACKDRKDLLVPNDLVRDQDGKIIGCRSFSNN